MPSELCCTVFHKMNTQCDLALAFLLLSRPPIKLVASLLPSLRLRFLDGF